MRRYSLSILLRPAFCGVLLTTLFAVTATSQQQDASLVDAVVTTDLPLSSPIPTPVAGHWQALANVVRSEEVLVHLQTQLPELQRSLTQLRFPDKRAAELFDEQVTVIDLAAPSGATRFAPAPVGVNVVQRVWSPAPQRTIARSKLQLWQTVLGDVTAVEDVHIETVDGDFTGTDFNHFRAFHRLIAQLTTRAGNVLALEGDFQLDWTFYQQDHHGAGGWRISAWVSSELQGVESRQTFFTESLAEMLPDPEQQNVARRSLHQKLMIDYLLDPNGEKPYPGFSEVSHDRHPGLAVVDIDQDGWDDLYVMKRVGRNQLLRNSGNGTFEDIAPALGLDIDGSSSSAIFADFDNDGDKDAFIGRTLQPSLLMFNEGGRFVDSAQRVKRVLPALVSAVTAADYDGDGLLDLYISCYSRNSGADALDPDRREPTAEEIAAAKPTHDLMLNHWGPANVLLRNVGDGEFEEVTIETGMLVWRQTYQASWADYDQDGDADLYLANDYAPNNLFQNQGDGTFKDVTSATGTADQGFGMGVAWGDYDNDGWQDLYVSNMFSKAGRRITAKVPGVDQRFQQMARGNTLFHNRDGRNFEHVSGLEAPALMVEKAGWSWGSQFVDIDNDSFLDLIAPNGYLTFPEVVALPGDT